MNCLYNNFYLQHTTDTSLLLVQDDDGVVTKSRITHPPLGNACKEYSIFKTKNYFGELHPAFLYAYIALLVLL